MGGDAGEEHLAAAELDEQQHIQLLQPHGVDVEQVTRQLLTPASGETQSMTARTVGAGPRRSARMMLRTEVADTATPSLEHSPTIYDRRLMLLSRVPRQDSASFLRWVRPGRGIGVHRDRLIDQSQIPISFGIVGHLLSGLPRHDRRPQIEVERIGQAGAANKERIRSKTSTATAYASGDGSKSGIVRWNRS